ncbi:hypothetical protein NtRootA1_32200 [Arthrobacter sp. NtRootA1]|nr:hypothetical protein NtRootA1_32200 [Arthrobacter sp. NtRootA1]
MGGFESQGGIAVVVEVETDAEASKPGNVHPGLGAQHPHGFLVAVARTGIEGIGDVGSNGITRSRLIQDSRDATLGQVRIAVRERAFSKQHHFGSGFGGKQG